MTAEMNKTSEEVRELVKRLDEQWGRRRFSDSPFGEMSCLLADAADALEALVAERDQMLIDLEEYRRDVAKLTEERDRLKDKVERLRNEKVGTHGPPELDDDARKLEAMGQDPGATFAAEPEVVCDTLVCIWGSNLTQRRSGLHDVSWVRCDGSHVQYYADNTPCFVCGRRVKIAGGG